jgi:8-oxo-dGTP diphosphatase
VLITRRRDGVPPWGFVTGEVEPGEAAWDAAAREVKEETGLEVRVGGELGRRVHPRTGRTVVYMAASPVNTAEPVVGDPAELTEVRWASTAEAARLMPDMFGKVRTWLASQVA